MKESNKLKELIQIIELRAVVSVAYLAYLAYSQELRGTQKGCLNSQKI